ncbi:glycosyl hydrolase [Tersicoccus solisilvae]|uniref:Glycosyl hydrolase n=1 Tax=Tersicoccus solisilvae TaxID=1882339 RepID=A0ABQ1P0U8_9MICC|nr:glycoside hydrolase family 3 N-terminal domain-containing protein [Tersicoccus solisilvae]GGC88711.1 glycosyl hydrolase [Tersicoccus solisilvae]
MHLWNDPQQPAETRVKALLAELTLDEKIGQLGSFWPTPRQAGQLAGDVAPMESGLSAGVTWDDATRHGLGHLTRNWGTEPVSVSDGLAHLRDYQRQVIERSRFGIPAIAHEECLTGFTAYGATVYPAAIAWGATFDPDLIERMAHAIGADLAAVGVHQGLSPLLDVVRDYRWGRVEETTGEDPYLVGTLGAAYVRGLQAAGVHATLKHFAGYSASRAGRNHAPVPMGRREFEDVMLYPFEVAVREGGVRSVMNSYSDVDGVPAASDRELLTGVLRDRWGFDGVVVSDYWAVTFLETMHRVAAGPAEAAAQAVGAGLDVELPNTGTYAHLAAAVDAGLIDEATIDVAVARVLRQKVDLGLLDPDVDPETIGADRDLDAPANRRLAREVAEQSIVLLANDGVLPLADGTSVALIGPCADEPRTFMGCYSFPNHVLGRYPDLGLGIRVDSLLQGLTDKLGDAVAHAPGAPVLEPDRSGFDAAVALAERSDVAVLAVGDLAGLFGQGTSGEGCDAEDLRLPGVQGDLVEAVLATGTPVVLVVVSGRPYALGDYADRCAAVVQAFMPGEEGAAALTDVLTGVVDPSGRLPVGIPATVGGQPGTYLAPPLGWYSEGVSNLDPRPLYPFGYGLGYARLTLGDATLDRTEVPVDGELTVTVPVSNPGERPATEVVQVYLHDDVAEVTRPIIALIGYAKVTLDPGESAHVRFRVHADRTSFTGVDLRRIVEPGTMSLRVGTSSRDTVTELPFTLTGQRRVVPEGRVLTTPWTLDRA